MYSVKSSGFAAGLILVGILAVTLVVGGAYIVTKKSDDSNNAQINTNTKEADSSEKQQSDGRDTQQNDNAYRLHGKLVAYNVNNGGIYPEASAEGWQAFIDSSKNQLVDPFTEKPYKFTAGEPEFGEIEYRYPASCDDARINFVEANSSRSYAFRLKFSDGIRCTHSL